MDEADVRFSQLVIWIKNHAIVGRKDYLPQHELIVFGWHGAHVFRRSKDKSVIFCPKPNKSPLHPTTKPIGLIRRLVLNSTNIGDAVYDGFGGSGTCLLACEQTKRRCFMIEQDSEYCQTVIRQWERLTKRKAELL
jgi:DNA modification methylase